MSPGLVPCLVGTLPSGAIPSHRVYASDIMNSMNFSAESFGAEVVVANETISPKLDGPLPSGPWIEVTIPLFWARKLGTLRHSVQLGSASVRSPAISSRMNEDQMTMAALPAK